MLYKKKPSFSVSKFPALPLFYYPFFHQITYHGLRKRILVYFFFIENTSSQTTSKMYDPLPVWEGAMRNPLPWLEMMHTVLGVQTCGYFQSISQKDCHFAKIYSACPPVYSHLCYFWVVHRKGK